MADIIVLITSIIRRLRVPLILILGLLYSLPARAEAPEGTVLAAQATWIHSLPAGPFITLPEGRILTVDKQDALISSDGGQTWQRTPLFVKSGQFELRPERALIRSRDGTIVLAFVNNLERSWHWDKATGEPGPDVSLPTYVTRSLDDGRTWEPPQKLHDGWTGAIRSMVQTPSGAIVFTTMKIMRNPGRHGSLTYTSFDDGKTWMASNLIDLGGHGHHDGALEPAIITLRDGRLWMLIRTTHDVFYESFSEDQGLTWQTPKPTTIDASTAPPMLHRATSGRLILVWNRFALEGQTDHPRRGGDNQWSARAASNQRNELSIAFSGDDGKTWTQPSVLVRTEKKDTSYPYIFEPSPGQLWITTMRETVKLSLYERDFVEDSNAPVVGLRVVALGDSITKGARLAKGDKPEVRIDETFAYQLSKRISAEYPNSQVLNMGVPSNRTDHAVERLERDVLAYEPDVVLVMYGTNDSCWDNDKTGPRLPVEQYEANLRQIITRVQEQGGVPILMTPPPLGSHWGLTRNAVYVDQGPNGPISDYVDTCRRLSTELGLPLVDHFAAWQSKPEGTIDQWTTDGCHPNALGHSAIADAIEPVLLETLAARSRR